MAYEQNRHALLTQTDAAGPMQPGYTLTTMPRSMTKSLKDIMASTGVFEQPAAPIS
jgi:hypothetical protein